MPWKESRETGLNSPGTGLEFLSWALLQARVNLRSRRAAEFLVRRIPARRMVGARNCRSTERCIHNGSLREHPEND